MKFTNYVFVDKKMGFNKFFKIGALLTMLLLCVLALSSPVSAQQPGANVAPADTVAADTSKNINSNIGSIGDTPSDVTISTSVEDDTELADLEAAQTRDNSGVYKSAYYYVLLFVLVCVFLGIIGKVLRVYELSREVQGKKGGVNWNLFQSVLFLLFLIGGLYGTYWSYSYWGNISTAAAASEHGVTLDSMMYTTIAITTFVFVITQILLFVFAFKYTGSNKRKAYFYPHNNAIERLWTIIPALVLTGLVVFGFFTWRKITNPSEDAIKNALSLEVTGEQFKWNVRYAGSDNQLGKRNYKLTSATNSLGIDFKDPKSWDDKLGSEIVLPVNKPVRVTINSKDILHSFYMPEFRVQMNAVPGMPTYFQFTPTITTQQMREKTNNQAFNYILLCAKICGAGHYNMQYKVRVVDQKEYEEWLAKQSLFFTDDVKKELQSAQSTSGTSVNNKLAINN
ncbi:cytochrome c oxidase subunit II [Desertivirga arenae]|uniref:cytochrome c oxidase subunit II n=1 Tax=Desertivirga arenae TaxID=2810309 RepID=UPI001F625F27|nr:cytochrome c oxidase subunit II [Pedobacter sp. SYSU D00823]